MKKKLPLILSIVLLVVFLISTLLFDKFVDRERLDQVSKIPDYVPAVKEETDPTQPQIEEGRKDAPEITVTDAKGNSYTLSQFRGKPVVVHFWASWSGSAQRELTMFQSAYNDYKDSVHFLIVNTLSDERETKEKAEKIIKDGNFTFPVYYDADASAANAFDVRMVPTSFFVDANGKGIAFAEGELNRYNFERGLMKCYENQQQSPNEETPEPTETE